MGFYNPVELKPHHKQAVRLSLQGYSHEEIGRLLGKHPKHISKLLNSKKARQLMQEYQREIDQAFQENFAESLRRQTKRLKEIASSKPFLILELMHLPAEARRRKLRKLTREPALDVSWTKKHSRRKRRGAEDVVREMMEQYSVEQGDRR